MHLFQSLLSCIIQKNPKKIRRKSDPVEILLKCTKFRIFSGRIFSGRIFFVCHRNLILSPPRVTQMSLTHQKAWQASPSNAATEILLFGVPAASFEASELLHSRDSSNNRTTHPLSFISPPTTFDTPNPTKPPDQRRLEQAKGSL